MNNTPDQQKPTSPATPALPPTFERLGQSLYWKGGSIVARVRVNGKPTWRSTGTSNPAEARAWLKKWKGEIFMLANGIEPKGDANTEGAGKESGNHSRRAWMLETVAGTFRGQTGRDNHTSGLRQLPRLADKRRIFFWSRRESDEVETDARGNAKRGFGTDDFGECVSPCRAARRSQIQSANRQGALQRGG
jgi:hypothetical protein